MPNDPEYTFNWDGKSLKVKILYSRAGYSQHILIESDKGALLFDTGDGILRDLKSSGLKRDTIEAIFYTHGHFDHMGGLHSLLGFLRMIGRTDDLYVFAPEGCIEVVSIIDNFINCYSNTIPFKIHSEIAEPDGK